MPVAKKTHREKPKTKLFQCTGFGDCRMVFTRSEHLLRHTRKHTGEKPFNCIVPGCTRRFSRFDNMMQHTQTHRHHHSVNNSSNSNDSGSMQSKSRSQQRRSSMSKIKDEARKPAALSVDTTSLSHENTYGGLVSPVSLGSPKQWDEMPASPKRRLSVADLCNPPEEYQVNLTPDEYEALEGFARFHENPIFFDSLRNLAAAACIEHRI